MILGGVQKDFGGFWDDFGRIIAQCFFCFL